MDVVNTIVLPLVAIVIFGLLGMLRGARREAYVSGAIVLAVLMSQQWGASWGNDLTTYISGLSASDSAFYVVLAIMILTVLVIGYGLGSSVVRGVPTTTSRMLGLLLGLLNGAAFAGWLLRFGFEFLDARSASSAIYRSEFDQVLMILAGWYPVALAALGAIVALVRAFKGDDEEVTVVRESVSTTAPPAVAAAGASYPGYAGYSAGAPGPPYGGQATGPSAPTAAYTPPPAPSWQGPASTSAAASVVPPRPEPQVDYPSSFAPPITERPVSPSAVETREIDTTSTVVTESTPGRTEAPAPALEPPRTDTSTSTVTDQAATTSVSTGDVKYYTPPFGMAAIKTDALDMDEPAAAAPVVAAASVSEGASSERKCLVCGTPYEPGQVFCTECGSRVTAG